MNEPLKILIVDDEPKMGKILGRVLGREGHDAQSLTEPEAALELIGERQFDLLLTDLKMPGMNGLELLERAKLADPKLEVIMMTAYASVETAIEALKKGAADYLIKPFQNEELIMQVARLAENRSLKAENRTLKESLASTEPPRDVIAASEPMQEVLKRVEKVAASDVSVLLRGESGTGKEVMATMVHALGPRRDKPLVKVNCGALPENLLASELFGHTRGAFTGAVETRKGLFLAADSGTIFLDEIGEVSAALQVKLLRVLQSGEFQRVGDPQTFKVNVRVIAATNRPLEQMIEAGTFREDLYYRLNVVPIVIPPLRERQADVPALIDFVLRRLNSERKQKFEMSPHSYRRLLGYCWPGNIRELENAIEHAAVLCDDGKIEVKDLPVALQNAEAGGDEGFELDEADEPLTLEQIERNALWDALEATRFNHTKAAEKLGITRRTLGYRIDKLGLPRKAKDAEKYKEAMRNGNRSHETQEHHRSGGGA